MKAKIFRHILKTLLFIGVLFIGSCASSKTEFQKEYNKVWKEMVKSEAWKNSLKTDLKTTTANRETVYLSSANTPMIDNVLGYDAPIDTNFKEKYHALVARAYFKIISEAEKLDKRLKKQYESLKVQQQYSDKSDKAAKQNFILISKRYYAHTKMLKGLKSWNIFSEYRSGDLDLFKEENIKEVHKMFQLKKTEDAMIGFLIYKLADLYHFEE